MWWIRLERYCFRDRPTSFPYTLDLTGYKSGSYIVLLEDENQNLFRKVYPAYPLTDKDYLMAQKANGKDMKKHHHDHRHGILSGYEPAGTGTCIQIEKGN